MDNKNMLTDSRSCDFMIRDSCSEDEINNISSASDAIKTYFPEFISQIQHLVYPARTTLDQSLKSEDSRAPTIVSSDSSETTLSVTNINQINKLPMVIPRDHGSDCILEISILEKHKKGCPNKKKDSENRHPLDDRAGSYDVINRVVYKTCDSKNDTNEEPALKSSQKGYKLNEPSYFGKDLKENRSRIEAIPILPESSSFNIMRAQTTGRKPAESVSIYIRMDKNEEVPKGFQKMHYKGDSCKLHDPTERSKQLLALQKVIHETNSGAIVSKSTKEFTPVESDAQVFATDVPPSKLPETLFDLNCLPVSNESLEIVDFKDNTNNSRSQQTETKQVALTENLKNVEKNTEEKSDISLIDKQTSPGLFKRLKKKKTKDESTNNACCSINLT